MPLSVATKHQDAYQRGQQQHTAAGGDCADGCQIRRNAGSRPWRGALRQVDPGRRAGKQHQEPGKGIEAPKQVHAAGGRLGACKSQTAGKAITTTNTRNRIIVLSFPGRRSCLGRRELILSFRLPRYAVRLPQCRHPHKCPVPGSRSIGRTRNSARFQRPRQLPPPETSRQADQYAAITTCTANAAKRRFTAITLSDAR